MCRCEEVGSRAVVANREPGRGEAWGPTKVLTPSFTASCTTRHLRCKQRCCQSCIQGDASELEYCPTCAGTDLAPIATNDVLVFTAAGGQSRYRRERCSRCGRLAITVYNLTRAGTWCAVRGVVSHPRSS